jgi:hypothetical protein
MTSVFLNKDFFPIAAVFNKYCCSVKFSKLILSRVKATKRVLDSELDLLHTYTARDYTSQITVTVLGSGFQRQPFLCFRAHVPTERRPSHVKLIC